MPVIICSFIMMLISSQLAWGGANIHYNTGNIGIGTTNPAAHIHIAADDPALRLESKSTTGFASQEIYNDTGEVIEMYIMGSAVPDVHAAVPKANLGMINYGGTNALMINTGWTAPIIIAPANTEAMRVSPNGNVGVGTTTPRSKLDVQGAISGAPTADAGLGRTFTGYSDDGVTALTVHMPPDNGNTIAGKHTIYSLLVSGTDVYVAWMPGY